MSDRPRSLRRIADFVDDLQASGRYTFAFREAVEVTGASAVAVRSAIRRLKEKGRVASPRREFYVIVPVEYRSPGCLPATGFVDFLMSFLGQPYYAGLLIAFDRMLWLNPTDNQGIRFLLPQIRAGERWEDHHGEGRRG